MSNVLFQTIDQISREKGIHPQVVVHSIEDAIVVDSRKYFKSNEELRGRINPETGEIDVYAIRKVVDTVTNPVREISLEEARTVKPDAQLEEEIEFKKPTVGLGRISAQMAKQVIFQKVREAERESVYAEYHKHVGEVVILDRKSTRLNSSHVAISYAVFCLKKKKKKKKTTNIKKK